jgi:hypothetical protein
MSQSGKRVREFLQQSVQKGTPGAPHRNHNAISDGSTVRSELPEFGEVDVRTRLEAENAQLRAKAISLVLEMQSLRRCRDRY